jgi:hypothetical protein
MIFAIGLGILGFVAMRRAHRRCMGYTGYGWYGPWQYHGYRGRGRERWMVHAALARLDASPAQERVIVGEIDRLKDRFHGARAGLKDARGDLGAAIRGPALDDAALGAVLGRFDAATSEARSAAIDALRGIHAVLDDKQRAQLGDFLDRGTGWWRGGPYR